MHAQYRKISKWITTCYLPRAKTKNHHQMVRNGLIHSVTQNRASYRTYHLMRPDKKRRAKIAVHLVRHSRSWNAKGFKRRGERRALSHAILPHPSCGRTSSSRNTNQERYQQRKTGWTRGIKRERRGRGYVAGKHLIAPDTTAYQAYINPIWEQTITALSVSQERPVLTRRSASL